MNTPNGSSTATLRRLRRIFSESSVEGIFLRGAGGSLIVRGGAAVAGLASHLVLARVLGAEVFGQYVFVLSWVMLLLIFALCGFDKASVRFVATYHGRGELVHLRGFLQYSSRAVLLASLCTSACLVLASCLLRSHMQTSLWRTFMGGAILLPLIALLHLRAFQLRGLKRILAGDGPLDVGRPLLVAGAAAMLLLVNDKAPAAADVMSANVVVTLLLVLVTTRSLVRALHPTMGDTKPEFDTSQWLRVAGALLLLSGLERLHARIDVLMLGFLVSTTDAGIYKVAADLATFVTFGLATVNMIMGPMISELHAQERILELQRAVRLAAICGFAVAVIAAPVMLFGGKAILRMFGGEFTAGYAALVIISIGLLVGAMAGPVSWILIMTGHHRESAIITGVSAISNVLLNLLLIPLCGIVGAAVATAVTVILQNVLMVIWTTRHLPLNPTLHAGMKTLW